MRMDVSGEFKRGAAAAASTTSSVGVSEVEEVLSSGLSAGQQQQQQQQQADNEVTSVLERALGAHPLTFFQPSASAEGRVDGNAGPHAGAWGTRTATPSSVMSMPSALALTAAGGSEASDLRAPSYAQRSTGGVMRVSGIPPRRTSGTTGGGSRRGAAKAARGAARKVSASISDASDDDADDIGSGDGDEDDDDDADGDDDGEADGIDDGREGMGSVAGVRPTRRGTGGRYSRKDKSLRLICDRFISLCLIQPSPRVVQLDRAAALVGVTRRRIYDIVNVLEALRVVQRISKNTYSWHGCSGINEAIRVLAETKQASFRRPNSLSTEERSSKSLGAMALRFLSLHAVDGKVVVSRCEVASALIGAEVDALSAADTRGRCRRMYDVANIMMSLGVLERGRLADTALTSQQRSRSRADGAPASWSSSRSPYGVDFAFSFDPAAPDRGLPSAAELARFRIEMDQRQRLLAASATAPTGSAAATGATTAPAAVSTAPGGSAGLAASASSGGGPSALARAEQSFGASRSMSSDSITRPCAEPRTIAVADALAAAVAAANAARAAATSSAASPSGARAKRVRAGIAAASVSAPRRVHSGGAPGGQKALLETMVAAAEAVEASSAGAVHRSPSVSSLRASGASLSFAFPSAGSDDRDAKAPTPSEVSAPASASTMASVALPATSELTRAAASAFEVMSRTGASGVSFLCMVPVNGAFSLSMLSGSMAPDALVTQVQAMGSTPVSGSALPTQTAPSSAPPTVAAVDNVCAPVDGTQHDENSEPNVALQ